jgi:hypothetical protein
MGTRGTNTRNGKAIEPGVAADSSEAAEEAVCNTSMTSGLVTAAERKAKTSSILTRKEKNPRRAAAGPDQTSRHSTSVD